MSLLGSTNPLNTNDNFCMYTGQMEKSLWVFSCVNGTKMSIKVHASAEDSVQTSVNDT